MNPSLRYFLVLLLVTGAPDLSADDIRVGVRAHVGDEKAIEKWKPTTDYLTEIIPEHRFILVPYEKLDDLLKATENNQIQFILTNPSSYIEIEVKAGASRLLTLRNKRGNHAYTQFGSVIFTRADRDDINNYQDLKGKEFMAVSPKAFGGWQVPLYELLRNGVQPDKDFSALRFGGGLQQRVVFAVRDRTVDAGTVRTDMLERLHATGDINIADFKVLEKKNDPDFGFLRSTPLYPEWAFAQNRNVSMELSNQVVIALLQIPPGHPAAVQGKYAGWTVPQSYQPVHELLKTLKVAPYDQETVITRKDVFTAYLYEFIAVFFFLVASVTTSIFIIRSNRRYRLLSEQQCRSEDELRQHKEELERLVSERTRDLETSNRELESYCYSLAHDLRTPLRCIVSFSQILREDAGPRLEGEESGHLDRITAAGKYMAELIDSILELSRIARVGLDRRHLNLSEITRLTFKRIRNTEADRNIVFNCPDKIECYADRRLMQSMMEKLVHNAFKFTRQQDHAMIELRRMEKEGRWVYSLADNGVGFDMQYADKIFKPFEGLHGRKELEGTGVGLAIVQRIVHRHGGEIWARSQNNHGATFYFTLPE